MKEQDFTFFAYPCASHAPVRAIDLCAEIYKPLLFAAVINKFSRIFSIEESGVGSNQEVLGEGEEKF